MKLIKVALIGLISAILGLGALPMALHGQVITQSNDPHKFGSTLELHVSDDGKVVLHGAKIEKIAGTTYFTKMYWGLAFLRLTIRTDEKTKFVKRFGTEMSRSQIKEGDYISVTGQFFSGSNSLDVTALEIKDWSYQTEEDQFSGIVTAKATSTPGFILKSGDSSSVTVSLGTTTLITRGSLTQQPLQIMIGDKIDTATGLYDHLTRVLDAKFVKIYQDMSIFAPKNFEGKIKDISNPSLPARVTVTIAGKDYFVQIPVGATVLNAKRQPGNFSRFIVGDSLRFYGAIRESEQNTIDAEIVRNLNM